MYSLQFINNDQTLFSLNFHDFILKKLAYLFLVTQICFFPGLFLNLFISFYLMYVHILLRANLNPLLSSPSLPLYWQNIFIFSLQKEKDPFPPIECMGFIWREWWGGGGGGKARREVPHSPILCLPKRTLCPIWSIYLVFRNLVEKLCFMDKYFF